MHVITPAVRAQDRSGAGGRPKGMGSKTQRRRLEVVTVQAEGHGGAAGATTEWAVAGATTAWAAARP